jgi:hypothetical protein
VSATERKFSDDLEEWLRSDGPKSLGALNEVFGEKTFAVTIILLMFLPALPLPTGGVTHVFELITVLIAMQMVVGRRMIWLPERFRKRELGSATTEKAIPYMIRRIRWFEKLSKPRAAWLFNQRWFLPVLGLLVIGFTVGAAIAPPFSGLDTLPALGVVVIALSIILEDIIVLAVGVVIGTGGVVLIVTLGAALARFFESLI